MKGPILNLGILAHADAGKTTVTEQLLLRSGSIRQAGSVDDGTTHTDWLEVERRRGISVRAASISLEYKGVRVNLIDTPGHVDFWARWSAASPCWTALYWCSPRWSCLLYTSDAADE